VKQQQLKSLPTKYCLQWYFGQFLCFIIFYQGINKLGCVTVDAASVEITICNMSAAQVVNSHAQPFFYFPFCSSQAMFFFLLITSLLL